MRASLSSVVSGALVLVQVAFSIPCQAADPPLSLVGTVPVGGTPDAIVVDHSPHHDDVVFYDRASQRVRFIDGETLTLSTDSVSLATRQWEGWLLYNRVHHLVYFIGSRSRSTLGGESWEEVVIHVLENRLKVHEFSLNEPWNPVSGSPLDPFYEIDGVLIKQPFVEDLNTRIVVDNTYGGNLDFADLGTDGIGFHQRQRGSYRNPVTPPYSWGRGNSIALESNHETAGSDDLLGQDLIYIADANGPVGQIMVMKTEQPQVPLAPVMEDPVDLTSDFLFSTGVPQGLDVAGPFDRLWMAPGTQGAVNGALGEVNTITNDFVGSVPLVYGDQYWLLADWFDPSRVFVCTFDGWYNDPSQGLYLHLLVNGAVVDTLKLLNNYEDYELRGMSFDPYTRRLYLTIDTSIYVVHVDYGPIADIGEIFSDGFESGNTSAW